MALEDYEPVAVRLERLLRTVREAGQTPAIITHLLSKPGDDVCVMRAELWIDGVLRATGHAEEIRGQGNVNRTSHLENAETSAVGRMCENYAPTTDWKKRPSREEMGKAERYTTSRPMSGGYKPVKASDKQKNLIRVLSKQVGRPVPASIDDYDTVQASEVINQLKKAQAESGEPEEPF